MTNSNKIYLILDSCLTVKVQPIDLHAKLSCCGNDEKIYSPWQPKGNDESVTSISMALPCKLTFYVVEFNLYTSYLNWKYSLLALQRNGWYILFDLTTDWTANRHFDRNLITGGLRKKGKPEHNWFPGEPLSERPARDQLCSLLCYTVKMITHGKKLHGLPIIIYDRSLKNYHFRQVSSSLEHDKTYLVSPNHRKGLQRWHNHW
jgi:hypothetical protein